MSKILIAIPCMDQVPAPFAQSLAMIQKTEDNVACAFQMGSLIYTSRNNLALQAMKAEFDYMLWPDEADNGRKWTGFPDWLILSPSSAIHASPFRPA